MDMGSAEIRVNPESFQDGTEKKAVFKNIFRFT